MESIIAWFAHNRVAAQLAMMLVMGGGLVAATQLQREVIPTLKLQRVQVITAYPGASPHDVESGVLEPIEEAIADLEGVKHLTSIAAEGLGTTVAEISEDQDMGRVLEQIKLRVSGIRNLSAEVETPVVSELLFEQPAIYVTLYGEADIEVLKRLGNQVLRQIQLLPEVTRAELLNMPPDEISIELSEAALAQYGLSFDYVAGVLKRTSLDIPAGELKTDSGGLVLRVDRRARSGEAFEALELIRLPDGTVVRLGDVAQVRDGIAETDQKVLFDGKPAVTVVVSRVGGQDVVDVTSAVKAYVDQLRPGIPEGIEVAVWRDVSKTFHDRINTLLSDGLQGLLLVFIALMLFMRPAVALWVCNDVVFSFLGTLLVMWLLGISLNMVTLFAFILVLGTLVDDGIVMGEAIYSEQVKGVPPTRAAINGATLVAWGVVVAVLTNIQTFMPIMYLPGVQAQMWAYVPMVVIIAYSFSLFESLFLLPAHLAHVKPLPKESEIRNPLLRAQRKLANSMETFARTVYGPALERTLQWRYVTISAFIGVLLVTVGVLGGGLVKISFFPLVAGDSVVVDITLESGTPMRITESTVERIEQTLFETALEFDRPLDDGRSPAVRHVMRSIGRSAGGLGLIAEEGPHTAQLFVELTPAETRSVDVATLIERWREKVEGLPHLEEIKMNYSLNNPGADLEINLTAEDPALVAAASRTLQQQLTRYPGVSEVSDNSRPPRSELSFELLPEGVALGLTVSDLGRQLRQGFHGEEVQRVQRGSEDVRVVVRYDAETRRSENALESLRIRTADGSAVPLFTVADTRGRPGDTLITRVDGRRATVVSADVDDTQNSVYRVLEDLESNVLPQLMQDYPGLTWSKSGQRQEEDDVMSSLYAAAGAGLAMVFAAIAILFRSYVQTILVFTVLPFAVCGAIFAHMIFGMQLSMLSLAGIVAALGVCVDDSMVLVEYVNHAHRSGVTRAQAVRDAGQQRFRPIVINSITAFIGLAPIMLNRSVQAQVLVPMAVSLAFSILVTTFITLFLLPSLISLFWADAPDEELEPEQAGETAHSGGRH